jgi:hypothetical protein
MSYFRAWLRKHKHARRVPKAPRTTHEVQMQGKMFRRNSLSSRFINKATTTEPIQSGEENLLQADQR